MTDETKPRSVAAINPTPDQKVTRHIGRIATLKAKLAENRPADRPMSDERRASLQAELDRRVGELKESRDQIDAALEEVNG